MPDSHPLTSLISLPLYPSHSFHLVGRIPSKKNSRIPLLIKGRIVSLPNNKHRTWHKEASKQLELVPKYEYVEMIDIRLYAPDKRRSDMTNKVESIMDLLVDNGIINDDSWFDVPKMTISFGGVRKEAPGAFITIYGKEKVQP